MADSIKRYASIVMVIATFIALAFFPIPSCFDCEFPNPYGLSDAILAHRTLLFEIWSVSAIFVSVFLRIKRAWLIPPGIVLADLITQHLGGVPWWSLRENEGPIIILVGLFAGFALMSLAFLCRMSFEWLRESKSSQSDDTLNQFLSSMLTPLYRDHPSFRLAGLRRFHTFTDAPRDIPKQWVEFNQLPIPGLHATKIFYGATCQTDLPNQRFEYMCGFEVPDLSIAPPKGRMIVPAAHYAVFTEPNGVATLHDTWQFVWKQWLPASGLKPAPTPDFERYDERFNHTTGEGPIEIWFPIQRQP